MTYCKVLRRKNDCRNPRNLEIYAEHCSGAALSELANKYLLSRQRIWEICNNIKTCNEEEAQSLLPLQDIPEPTPTPVVPVGPLCHACSKRKPASHKRGFCWKCYSDPEIRERFPATVNRHTDKGYGLETPKCLCSNPTDALPGTEKKIRVMEARAKAGVFLHHPKDAR